MKLENAGNTLGLTLKELRERKGNSQAELGQLLRVKAQTYSAYERGVSLPDVNTLSILADFFGVTTDYILGRVGDDAKQGGLNNSGHISGSAVVNGSGTIMVMNGESSSRELTKEEQEILRIYSMLDVKSRMKMLDGILKIEEEFNTKKA